MTKKVLVDENGEILADGEGSLYTYEEPENVESNEPEQPENSGTIANEIKSFELSNAKDEPDEVYFETSEYRIDICKNIRVEIYKEELLLKEYILLYENGDIKCSDLNVNTIDNINVFGLSLEYTQQYTKETNHCTFSIGIDKTKHGIEFGDNVKIKVYYIEANELTPALSILE